MSNPKSDHRKNVIISGLGYVNRIREVQPKNGQSYLACDVALMQSGYDGKIDLARFSCIIRGKEAIDVIRSNFTNPNGEVGSPKATVMANMDLGGILAETFVHKRGEKAGETGIALRSSLLRIKWLKIGNKVVDLGQENQPEAETQSVEEQDPTDPVREMTEEYEANGSVRLAKDHPQFELRREWLRDNDFRWDRKVSAWVRKSGPKPAPARQEEPREVPSQPPETLFSCSWGSVPF